MLELILILLVLFLISPALARGFAWLLALGFLTVLTLIIVAALAGGR